MRDLIERLLFHPDGKALHCGLLHHVCAVPQRMIDQREQRPRWCQQVRYATG
ncbi:hypothetical protein [Gemmatimonas sp.]|uniref:hypothetical protein n=1 Tax=Gemmatimonas sp. TaxID=1962908 RepID=UPI003DA61006